MKADINKKPTWQMREISAQESYCSENLYSHFGLGDASSIDSIIVKWPSGIKQYLTNVDTNQMLTIVEDTLLFTRIKPICSPYTAIKSNNEYKNYDLLNIIPNPVNEVATISYHITTPGPVSLILFGINGIEIRKIVSEYKHADNYNVLVDTSGLQGNIYLLSLRSNETVEYKKLLVVK